MKSSNKTNYLFGAVLLIISAIFTISLTLQALDFGVTGPGRNNILYYLGDMLFSVYGFSSILIPLFLFLAGISNFATIWTSKKTMLLITALIPFFTSVFTEKICLSIIEVDSSDVALKIAITAVTGLMLIIIEIVGAIIGADRINEKLFKSKTNKPNFSFEEETQAEIQQEPETEVQNIISEPVYQEEPSIFDDALSSVQLQETEYIQQDNDDDELPQNPGSIITQEEYAALTVQDDELFDDPLDETQEETSDLDWPNLPPQPDSLPAEYNDEDEIDLDDPALEFPPKDEDFNDEILEEKDLEIDLDLDIDFANEDENEKEETPYSTAAFIDSFAQNKSPYSSGISIHGEPQLNVEEDDLDDDFENSVPEKKKETYSSVISLVDDDEISDDDYDESFEIDEILNENNDDFEFDSEETEEFEEEAEEPVSNIFDQISQAEAEDDFSDNDDLENEEIDIFDEEIESDEDEIKINDEEENFVEDDEDSSEVANYSISDVFSEMENDIKEGLLKNQNSSSAQASNLTKDELTDFFNAQQVENTPPVSKQIEANPPKTNRAAPKRPYVIPSNLLTAYENDPYWIIDEQTKSAAVQLTKTLAEFNIEAQIVGIKKGPVVTMFEILPATGVKLSKIVTLQDNIALSLAANSVRIVAPIPGKSAVGIEVPNKVRSIVGFREIIEQDVPEYKKMAIPVVLGKDILGKTQLIDLVKTPHMLIAGATGSGKSVCVNSIILSILYKRSYKDVKLILIDPKVVELKLYNNIPHLLTPVITDPKRAFQALQYCICEMERRYALLDSMAVRDIANYNKKIEEQNICTEKLPYIVVIIDEFADLMATTGKELENIVARLAAKSRAAGIHLVLATQRPSVNVITGLIKSNIPTRIAFMVTSRTDSQIIIDKAGAEKLLGRGDMLFASAVEPAHVRIQGTFVSDSEVENVVDYVKTLGEPDYIDDEIFVEDDDSDNENVDLFGNPAIGDDPLYDQALEIVVQAGKASASYIQRRLKIGYNRAARLVEEMEERGIVGPANGSKPREIIHIP